MTEREKFEAWYSQRGVLDSKGFVCNTAWEAWQAALESRVLAERKQVAQWQTKLRDPILPECDTWINVSEEGARKAMEKWSHIYEVRALCVAHPTRDDASQWVSVDDRLPSWTDGRTSKTKVYVMARTSGGVEKECGFFLAGPNGCFDDHDFSPLHRVTHWKPLDAAIDRARQSGEEGKC